MAAADLPEGAGDGGRGGFPLNHWDARQRRNASLGALVAGVFLLGFTLVVWQVLTPSAQTETFLLAVLALLVLVALFQVLVVVTGIRQGTPRPSESGGLGAEAAEEGPWEPPGSADAWGDEGDAAAAEYGQAYAPPAPAGEAVGEPITLKCSNCATVFDVGDTGERPLRHTCPGCGLEGELTEEDIGPAPHGMAAEAGYGTAAEEEAIPEPRAAAPAAPAAAPEMPELTLKCGNCATVFDVTDTGDRPLRHTCPGCGLEGELTEEDIGPPPVVEAPEPMAEERLPGREAPAEVSEEFAALREGHGAPAMEEAEEAPAAPPKPKDAQAPAKAPAKPGPGKVKALKLRCKTCQTVFTLRDTGTRPLYHECPGCKATGVLR